MLVDLSLPAAFLLQPDAGSSAEDITAAEGSSLAIKAGGSGSSIGLRRRLRQGRRLERS